MFPTPCCLEACWTHLVCCYTDVYLHVLLQTTVSWEGDKLKCVQLGEKADRGWTHWLEGDKLHLVRIKRGSGTGGVVEHGRRKTIKCSCKMTPSADGHAAG